MSLKSTNHMFEFENQSLEETNLEHDSLSNPSNMREF